jgi:hypothetical protein
MQKIVFTALLLFHAIYSDASILQGGFSKEEYIGLLEVTGRFVDSAYFNPAKNPDHFRLLHKSSEMGLQNQWSLWLRKDNVAVISIRGTVASNVSWLANMYAAMVPAKGELILAPTDTFRYNLSSDVKAAVHIGWLLATAYLSKDVLMHIDSCYAHGIKEFIITGHSQGGAIAFLMTAYLASKKKDGTIAEDIIFKTYCSAAPKPGNLYFAYAYEDLTKNGWGFNVVNSADWVPETPVTIQTKNDFNTTNPLVNAKKAIRKQKFPMSTAVLYVYNRLAKTPLKAQRQYQKYLGRVTGKIILRTLKEYKCPTYYASTNYVRTGNVIVLIPDDNYFKLFPESKTNVFIHHMFEPYYYLAKQL